MRWRPPSPSWSPGMSPCGTCSPAGSRAGSSAGENRDLGQLRVFDAVLSVLDELTATTPVLLVVEDLHWADRSSRDLLVFLLSRLGGQRLIVLATYRADELHRRHPLRPVLSELVRLPAVERVELAPLDPGESLELVRLLADGTLSEPMLRSAARRSEGNAFFAEELVSASSDGLPHGLAEVLVARVDGLCRPTPSGCCGSRRSPGGGCATTGWRRCPRCPSTIWSRRCARPSPTTCWSPEAERRPLERRCATSSGTRCCGRRSTTSCCRASAAGCTPPTPRCSPATARAAAAPATPAGPPSSRTTRWPATTCPWRWRRRSQAAAEANDREAPAEMLLHAERAIELWPAVPDAEAVAGVDEGTLTRWAAWGASATGDPDRGIALGGGRSSSPSSAATRSSPRRSGGGTRCACSSSAAASRRPSWPPVARWPLIADLPPSGDLAWAHAVLAGVHLRLDHFAEAVAEAESALAVARAVPADDLRLRSVPPPTRWSRWPCARSTAAIPTSARRRLERGQTTGAARPATWRVELRAYYVVGLSLLDEGRLAEAGARVRRRRGARRHHRHDVEQLRPRTCGSRT